MTSQTEDLIEDNDEYIRELDELKSRECIEAPDFQLFGGAQLDERVTNNGK
jgi:hypothetical protein